MEDFIFLRRWTRRRGGAPGQLVFGDALYLKDLDRIDINAECLAALSEIAKAYCREDILLLLQDKGLPVAKYLLKKIRLRSKARAALSQLNYKLGNDYYYFI